MDEVRAMLPLAIPQAGYAISPTVNTMSLCQEIKLYVPNSL